ncbi:hypothetical protein CLERM_099 [Coxiella-like endosymbiont]|nr:hypothetical protein CLERM_099 [Coxiella-like endosymbiont]
MGEVSVHLILGVFNYFDSDNIWLIKTVVTIISYSIALFRILSPVVAF